MTITELAASLTHSPASYLKAARILAAGTIVGLRPLRVNVLSTFTAQFLGPYLQVEGALRGFLIEPWFAPWGQLEEQALDEQSELYTSQPHVIVVLARFEDLDSMMPDRSLAMGDPEKLERLAAIEARFESLVAGLRKRTKCPIFIANCPPPMRPVEGLAAPSLLFSQSAVIEMFNHALAAIGRIQPDVFVFDLSRAASDHGLSHWHDPKLYFLARVPFGASAQIVRKDAILAEQLIGDLCQRRRPEHFEVRHFSCPHVPALQHHARILDAVIVVVVGEEHMSGVCRLIPSLEEAMVRAGTAVEDKAVTSDFDDIPRALPDQ